jgi:membrane dipeptidase
VIGICPYNEYIQSGWKMGDPRTGITLDNLITRIDYVCQLVGSVDHVGIGSDFDGGFGLESVPEDVNSIADMIRISDLLERRGYSQMDIEKIFNGNWLRILERSLPSD